MSSRKDFSVPTVTQTVQAVVAGLGEFPTPKEEKIRLLAYYKSEEAGFPCGEEEKFWLEAESELIEAEDFD